MRGVKLGIGGVKYESNSFGVTVAPEDLFVGSTLRRGNEVFVTGASSEYDGALRAASQVDLTLVPLVASDNTPGGTADHSQYLRFKEIFMTALSEVVDDLDGVVLVMHGAMTTTHEDDADFDFVRAVREILGEDKILVVTHDLHASPSPDLIGAVDALIGYKTCPHVDLDTVGERAVLIAASAVRREIIPKMVMVAIPMLTPAEGHDTIDGLMAAEQEILRDLVEDIGLLDATIFMCQPWLDTPRSSWRLTAVFDGTYVSSELVAEALLSRAKKIWEIRNLLREEKVSVEAVRERIHAFKGDVPLLLADGGDSPSAGSAGDSTDLLEAIIFDESARRKLAIVADPSAARLAAEAGIGSEVTLSVGGRLSGLSQPITVSGIVQSLGDGKFTRILPPGPDDLGQTATIKIGATTLFITSRPPTMLDQTVYRHSGIDLGHFDAIQVKSAGGFRAHWADLSNEIIYVDTRGASDSSLTSLPFSRVGRPLWPFDKIESPAMEVTT